ncbi:MAG TPA: hypothetical protein VFL42_07805, partial [Terriglobales bacterium]|nr:hypothetical protein [Terriglobales bacterium]
MNAIPGTRGPADAQSIAPPVHLEFIQNQLENRNGNAIEDVESYHRALFHHHHAVEWERHRQNATLHEERASFVSAQLKGTELALAELQRFVPVTVEGKDDVRPTLPWNGWDIVMFVAAALGIVLLITFGVLNISFNLLESGFVTFRENPFRSYLWAALLPVGALAVKVGWDLLPDPRHRNRYAWTCLTFGLGGVLAWAAAYALVYPTLSKGIHEQIASLSVFDTGSGASTPGLAFTGAKWVDVITVAGQAIAEIFLSAVLGIYLTIVYGRHRPVRLAQDPRFVHLEGERQRLRRELDSERLAVGEAKGNLVRLENQLSALVAFG